MGWFAFYFLFLIVWRKGMRSRQTLHHIRVGIFRPPVFVFLVLSLFRISLGVWEEEIAQTGVDMFRVSIKDGVQCCVGRVSGAVERCGSAKSGPAFCSAGPRFACCLLMLY